MVFHYKKKIMKKILRYIILSLKGLLFYFTTLVTVLFLCGIDSIMEQGYFIPAVLIVAGLISLCVKTINERELEIFLLKDYFSKN